MDIQRIKDILQKDGSFVIVVGQNYTIDEMGAALSLYLALTSQGKDVAVVSGKTPLVEVSNLVGIDKVKSTYESKSGDLIVSFPYKDDEIGKVSYTLESGLLNIIVKPKNNSLSFGEKDVLFRKSADIPAVLITVGVKRLSELSGMFNIEGLKNTTIINIDKAQNNEGYGDVIITSQSASSTSEQVANLFLSLGMPFDSDISQNLMSGIISATGNFQSPRTSSLAFEMAGILLRNGARREGPRVTQPQSMPQAQSQRQFGQPRQQAYQTFRNAQPNQTSTSPQQIREFPREQKKDEAPPDWLAPKIFKGSTNVE